MLLHAHFRRSNNQSRIALKARSSRPSATARRSSCAHTATTCGTFAGPGWLGTTGRKCATGSITCTVATTEGRSAAPCSRTPVSMAHRIGRDVRIREYIVGHTHRGSQFLFRDGIFTCYLFRCLFRNGTSTCYLFHRGRD